MTVSVHSIVIICLKFLFVDRLGPTATLIQHSVVVFQRIDPIVRRIKGKDAKFGANEADIV